MKQYEFNWIPGLFLITYHLVLLFSFPIYLLYQTPGYALWLTTFLLYFLSGLSITAGYHRLYAHRAYKAHRLFELVLLWFGSLSAQGSVLRWAYDHRLHHAHTDTHDDPHSIKTGFWYAHMLWLFKKPREIEQRVVPDLMANPLLSFQHRHYALCILVSNLVTCGLLGWYFHDLLGAFVLLWLFRMFALHHSTWFVNSLAHTWGTKPLCQELSAVDNFLLSLVTFGEGYHNYHHTFANDYRNGVRWYHFDPTKWLIWMLSKLGLTRSLRRTDQLVIKKRLVLERRNQLLEQIEDAWEQGREELEQRVKELSDRLLEQLSVIGELRKRLAAFKKEHSGYELVEELIHQMGQAKKDLKRDWKLWLELSQNILQAQTSL